MLKLRTKLRTLVHTLPTVKLRYSFFVKRRLYRG